MDDPNNKRVYSKVWLCRPRVITCVIGFHSLDVNWSKLAQNPDYWNSYKVIPLSRLVSILVFERYFCNRIKLNKKNLDCFAYRHNHIDSKCHCERFAYTIFQTIGAALASLISQFLFFSHVYLRSTILLHTLWKDEMFLAQYTRYSYSFL